MPLLQGVIKLGEKRGESKVTLVYGQMNEPPGARARVALTGERMDGKAGRAYGYGLPTESALHGSRAAGYQGWASKRRGEGDKRARRGAGPELGRCAPHAGLTVAEYFRDVEGQDVLLFVDNIFRFTQVRGRGADVWVGYRGKVAGGGGGKTGGCLACWARAGR